MIKSIPRAMWKSSQIVDRFWSHFGSILGSFWSHFGTLLGTIVGSRWGAVVAPFSFILRRRRASLGPLGTTLGQGPHKHTQILNFSSKMR